MSSVYYLFGIICPLLISVWNLHINDAGIFPSMLYTCSLIVIGSLVTGVTLNQSTR